MPVRKGFLDGYIHTPSFDNSGEIKYMLLTEKNHEYCNSHLWYAEYLDIRNGFVTEFTMDIGQHTCKKIISKTYKKCNFWGWGCKYYYEYSYDSCEAEGFAFVIQNSNRNATGMTGSGLGYEGIKDSLAVEFDFQHSSTKGDPTGHEHHIGVIMKRGLATANHKDSLVNNYHPRDFYSTSTIVNYKKKNL